MTARDTKRRSLEWISRIRDAQAQQAEWSARQAVAAVGVAIANRSDAEKYCEDALVRWALSLGEGARFDPALAAIWAHELNARDANLMDAEDVASSKQDEQARAVKDWQQSAMRARRAADDLTAATRRAACWRSEQQVAALADIAALKHVSR